LEWGYLKVQFVAYFSGSLPKHEGYLKMKFPKEAEFLQS